MARGSGKREKLVQAALGVFYTQGVARSSLADVAARADVKLGNVYYYFKTKEELVEAVVDLHQQTLQATFVQIEAQHGAPLERLVAFVMSRLDHAGLMSVYGCPHGSLSCEVRKSGAPELGNAARLVPLYIDWLETQFQELEVEKPRHWALDVFAVVQGTIITAQAYGDSEQMRIPLERLVERLRSTFLERP